MKIQFLTPEKNPLRESGGRKYPYWVGQRQLGVLKNETFLCLFSLFSVSISIFFSLSRGYQIMFIQAQQFLRLTHKAVIYSSFFIAFSVKLWEKKKKWEKRNLLLSRNYRISFLLLLKRLVKWISMSFSMLLEEKKFLMQYSLFKELSTTT